MPLIIMGRTGGIDVLQYEICLWEYGWEGRGKIDRTCKLIKSIYQREGQLVFKWEGQMSP